VKPHLLAGLVRVWRGLYARPASAFGTSLLVLFAFCALFGPLLAPYGENEQLISAIRQPPSWEHFFGTDNLGRDVFSRVLLGAGDILFLSGLGTLLSVVLGALIGLFSGYRGGWFDELVMRFFDSLLSIPALLLALVLLGSIGAGRNNVLIVIVVVYTPIVARVVRSIVLKVKTRGFVEAAQIQGESELNILLREILPSVWPALAVETGLRFSYSIFLIASLGFLGLGVQPPSPDWGLMVKEARVNVSQTPWAMAFPTGAIAMLVIGVNLTADGLKHILQDAR
jgi:peptide/nickel transport system permease protein